MICYINCYCRLLLFALIQPHWLTGRKTPIYLLTCCSCYHHHLLLLLLLLLLCYFCFFWPEEERRQTVIHPATPCLLLPHHNYCPSPFHKYRLYRLLSTERFVWFVFRNQHQPQPHDDTQPQHHAQKTEGKIIYIKIAPLEFSIHADRSNCKDWICVCQAALPSFFVRLPGYPIDYAVKVSYHFLLPIRMPLWAKWGSVEVLFRSVFKPVSKRCEDW